MILILTSKQLQHTQMSLRRSPYPNVLSYAHVSALFYPVFALFNISLSNLTYLLIIPAKIHLAVEYFKALPSRITILM